MMEVYGESTPQHKPQLAVPIIHTASWKYSTPQDMQTRIRKRKADSHDIYQLMSRTYLPYSRTKGTFLFDSESRKATILPNT